jgi:hypothetical protein
MSQKLLPGDLVEIRPVNKIAKTLDAEGAMDTLPFMAEMLESCGKRFRVSRRAQIACISGGPHRGLNSDNVVTLDGVRCSGAAHDGCQKACMIFWREEWLRKVEDGSSPAEIDAAEVDRFRARLPSISGKMYYCQASQLLKYTHVVARREKVTRYLSGWRYGNFNLLYMIHDLTVTVSWWVRGKLFGIYGRGPNTKSTPSESLNLRPGEWVEVKPMSRILETLDRRAMNRGLFFAPEMRRWCGRKLRVRNRLDRMIEDDTGQMRQPKNTVCLEGSTRGCAYVGIGMADCSRCEFSYWREIWLERCESQEAD